MKKFIAFLILTTSLPLFANDIAKSFIGKFELYEGTAGCSGMELVLNINYKEDGNPSSCLFGQGPRLVLTENESEVIKCLDHKDQQAWMDNYRCNFVSDARTSIKNGKKTITQRSGRKCLLSRTKWSSISTLTLETSDKLVISTQDEDGNVRCSYKRIK